MARQLSGFGFVILNILVSLGVAVGVITLYSNFQSEPDTRARPTIVLVFSPTPDPNQPLSAPALQATLDAQSGTLVALQRDLTNAQALIQQLEAAPAAGAGDSTGAETGSGIIPTLPASNPVAQSDRTLPTIDPRLIPTLPNQVIAAAQASPVSPSPSPEDGCQRYFVQSGDTASTIAARFEVSLSDLFVLNGLNDRTVLQIDQELLIPSPACEPEVPPTETPTPRPTFNLTIVAPTATLPPTAANAQVRIVQVLNPGDITSEQVEIQNTGGEINLRGWQLADSQGNIFTFPEVRLVPGSVIRILSRVGTNTPGFLYWNQTSAVWTAQEAATLSNAEGEVQSVLNVSSQVINFGPSTTPTP